MTDPKKLAQLVLAAITAGLHDDRASAEVIYEELAAENVKDVARTAVGMTEALLKMLGSEGERLLLELARWVAET